MAGRPGGSRFQNAIRGPQSALTDFLASHNISARQIREDYEQRVRAAEDQAGDGEGGDEAEDEHQQSAEEAEGSASAKKRKRQQDAAIEKIKQNKKLKNKIQKAKAEDDDTDSEELSDGLAFDFYAKSKPLPGQIENCEECGKRFTVTPYSKEGANGGLLCTKCSKAKDVDKKKAEQNKKSQIARDKRRQLQSNLLDGEKPIGVKPLLDLCVQKVADNIQAVEEFGELPPRLLDRLSQILSKRRLITSRTLDLFLRPEFDAVSIYDCGKLEPEDFIKIFAFTPRLKALKLENSGQFKDNVIDYILERPIPLESLKLEAANLVTSKKWSELFLRKGMHLRELKLTWLDSAMEDETVSHITTGCPDLQYLKIKKCFRLTREALKVLGMTKFKKLQHLHLQCNMKGNDRPLVKLIRKFGPRLRSLTLDEFTGATDAVLAAIHQYCRHLTKLRITDNAKFTDAGLAALFTNWGNVPLTSLNLTSVRSFKERVENETTGELSPQIGVGPAAFAAIMHHSGSSLERLCLASCRHIGQDALSDAFVEPVVGQMTDAMNQVGSKNGFHGAMNGYRASTGPGQYPCLRDIDLSFVEGVDTPVVAGIFRSAPKLERLAVFGCFGVKELWDVPPGVALIGVPHAQDSIIMEG